MGPNNVHLIKIDYRRNFFEQSVGKIDFDWQKPVFVKKNNNYIDKSSNNEKIGYTISEDGSVHIKLTPGLDEVMTETLLVKERTSDKNSYINKDLLRLGTNKDYMDSWESVEQMCRWVKLYGMSMPEDVKDERYVPANCYNGAHVLEYRKHLYQYLRELGVSEIITFCNEMNPSWKTYRSKGWEMADFIEWGKKELIYVNFSGLATFEFPKEEPDYYRVFIYDDFADLKALEKK